MTRSSATSTNAPTAGRACAPPARGSTSPREVTVEARRIEVPTPVTNTLPERGDVWRLAWEDVRQLAVVLEVGGDGIVVSPLFDDPDDVADEWTRLFDAPTSALGIGFGIGVAHRFTLPLFVFDARLSQIEAEIMSGIDDGAAAYRHGARPNGRTGGPVHGRLDPRIEALGEIADEFAILTEATWVEPVVADTATDWLALDDLDLLEPRRLLELSKGAPPSPEEFAAAAEHGVAIGGPGLDESLVSFLDVPLNSTRVRRRAAREHRSEVDVRREVAAMMANRQFALAARGGDGSTDWAPLLEEVLDETGD
jgi:hypothetical protein